MKQKYAQYCDTTCFFSLCALAFFIPISIALIEIFISLAIISFTIKKINLRLLRPEDRSLLSVDTEPPSSPDLRPGFSSGERIIKPDFEILKSPLHLFLLLFFIFSALSLFNSGIYLKKSLLALFFKWGKYILIFIIAEDTLRNPKRIFTILSIVVFGSLLLALDSLSQRFFSFEFIRHRELTKFNNCAYGITASFHHANDFGAYLNVILGFLISCLCIEKNKKIIKTGLWVFIILLELLLFLTFSRGSLIAFVIMLAAMLLLVKKSKLPIIISLIFIILISGLPIFQEKLNAFCSLTRVESWGRLPVWRVTARMIRDNPIIGKGIGTFMDHFPKYAPQFYVQYAHNCYLQIWAETGILGLLSFLLFAGTLLYSSISSFLRKQDYVLLGLFAGIFAFLIHSFIDTDLYSLQLSVLFWLAAGILRAKIYTRDYILE